MKVQDAQVRTRSSSSPYLHKLEQAPLDELTPHILHYWKTQLNDKEIVHALQKHFNTECYGIGLTKFCQIHVDMGLECSHQQGHTVETIYKAVTELHQMFLYAGTQEMIGLLFHEKNMSVAKSVMMSYFDAYEPELVWQCKARQLKWKCFWAASVNDLFTVDQHDKWLSYHLDTIAELGHEFQTLLCQHYNPTLQGTLQHCWMCMKKNVMPEITWSQLQHRFTPGFKTLLDEGIVEGWYDSGNTLHMCNHNKVLPHGVPSLIYNSSEDFRALDFKVSIDCKGINYVHNFYIHASHLVFDIVPPTLAHWATLLSIAMTQWNVLQSLLSAVQLAENLHPNSLLTENEDVAADALPLMGSHDDLPFNEEPDGTYYMGGNSHIRDLDALAKLDEPNVPSDDSATGVDHTALTVWQFSSDESENDGTVDECLLNYLCKYWVGGMSGVLSKLFALSGNSHFKKKLSTAYVKEKEWRLKVMCGACKISKIIDEQQKDCEAAVPRPGHH
ncbi:hypothetical protein F4604DRAFT_1683560 [Suillus subluteus]|nr:hypothetical protein F4604DRAFT_1683560 [Suillus subluteus]